MSGKHRDSNSSLNSGCDTCAQMSQLEVEAVSAVHEIAPFVKSFCLSEVLSRTPDLIFLNLTTFERQTYCIELTQRGWRICSDREDCMNGDFRKLELHARYFETIYQLLDTVSPIFREKYAAAVALKLNAVAESTNNGEAEMPQNEREN